MSERVFVSIPAERVFVRVTERVFVNTPERVFVSLPTERIFVKVKTIKRPWLLPDFKNSPYEGYAVRYLKPNFWRFSRIVGTWADAMSEAAIAYYRCRRKYGAVVENPGHFMALYKTVLFTHFTDLANRSTKDALKHEAYANSRQPRVTIGFDGNIGAKLKGASVELKKVLGVIFQGPAEVVGIIGSDARNFFKNAILRGGANVDNAQALEYELRSLLS